MLDKIKNNYSRFFMVCFSILMIFLILVNSMKPNVVSIIGTVLGVFFLIIFKRIKIEKKWLFILLLIAPLLARISLLFLSYGNLESDYSWFYNNALAFKESQGLANTYIATFPYLHLYVVTLGSVFKMLGTGYFVVVLVNLIFELVGIFFFYKALKDKPYKNKALLLYLYNPFSILWLTKCCPVAVVNAMLMIIFYVFSKINFKTFKETIIYSLLLGILMGITNNYRPILIIFVIALFFYYIYRLIQKEDFKKVVLSFVLVIFSFFLVNKFFLYQTEKDIGIKIGANESGWSMFVGANYEYSGRWNPEDSSYFDELIEKHGPSKAHKILKSEALERYKSYGLKSGYLLLKKAAVLGRNLPSYTYDGVFYSIKNIVPGVINFSLNVYLFAYLIFILLLCAYNAHKVILKRYPFDKYMTFATFGFGVFCATLILEVHSRYFMPILLPLIYFASTQYEEKESS